MNSGSNHEIVTAISDPDFEGFIATTLFSQGWSVIYRAMDMPALEKFCEENATESAILILSPGLDGMTSSRIKLLEKKFVSTFLFQSKTSADNEFENILTRPNSALELLGVIRGSLRAPMVRSTNSRNTKDRKARVLALGSLGRGAGCTTFALNLAIEISLLQKSVLLIDGNHSSPAISILLDQRKLTNVEPINRIGNFFHGVEFIKENASELLMSLDKALEEYDFIILDLGSLHGFTTTLTDRRWENCLRGWVSNHGDILLGVTRGDVVSQRKLREFVREIGTVTIRPRLGFILSNRSTGRSAKDEQEIFLTSIKASTSRTRAFLPNDARSVQGAEDARSTLFEANPKAALRKAIALFAREMTL